MLYELNWSITGIVVDVGFNKRSAADLRFGGIGMQSEREVEQENSDHSKSPCF